MWSMLNSGVLTSEVGQNGKFIHFNQLELHMNNKVASKYSCRTKNYNKISDLSQFVSNFALDASVFEGHILLEKFSHL